MLAVYVIVRVLSFPSDLEVTRAVSHDSGYIGIVARNLLAGRGFVNDAHWLMFLDPPALPMYYHNANPLYPALTAALMAVSGAGPVAAGAFLSILGSALGAVAVFFLVRHFGASERMAIVCAAVPLFLPPLFRISFSMLPDALSMGLIFCLLAVVVRARKPWHWVLAGVGFGLAWLTRSTAALVIPAVVVWLLGRRGVRQTLIAGSLCGLGALAVASPWLVRNMKVRGGPFESDSSFYLLIDYYATRGGRSVDELYRSLQPPAPVHDDVAGILRATAEDTPVAVARVAAAAAQSDVGAAIVLMAAFLCGAWCVLRRRWNIELVAVVVLFATTIGVFAVRGEHLEPRYMAVCYALLGLLLVAPFGTPLTRRTAWLRLPSLLYLVAFLLPQSVRIATEMRRPDAELLQFRAAATTLDRVIPDTTAVVSHLPYLFTLYTGRHAVSPPYPGKRELLRVMHRYQASHLVLPADKFADYYRDGPGSLGPELKAVARPPHYLILQRRPAANDLARRSGIQ
jgi:4-amino-4-deoxy-L-arabinose transferase-like glycosyltransferase